MNLSPWDYYLKVSALAIPSLLVREPDSCISRARQEVGRSCIARLKRALTGLG